MYVIEFRAKLLLCVNANKICFVWDIFSKTNLGIKLVCGYQIIKPLSGGDFFYLRKPMKISMTYLFRISFKLFKINV